MSTHNRLIKTSSGIPNEKNQLQRIDPTTELAYIPKTEHKGPFPGLYIFTQPASKRTNDSTTQCILIMITTGLIRPVLQLKTSRVEWIGPMEQIYMNIACLKDDIVCHGNNSGTFTLHPCKTTYLSDYTLVIEVSVNF